MLLERKAQIKVSLGIIRVNSHRLAKFGDGLGRLAQRFERMGQVTVALSQVRIEIDRCPQAGDGLGMATCLVERAPQIVMCRGIAGPHLHNLSEALGRRVPSPQLDQQVAQLIDGFRSVGAETNDFSQASDRRIGSAQRQIDRGEIRVKSDLVIIDRYRPSQVVDRQGVLAATVRNGSQQV